MPDSLLQIPKRQSARRRFGCLVSCRAGDFAGASRALAITPKDKIASVYGAVRLLTGAF
jgi:hypothetical protein